MWKFSNRPFLNYLSKNSLHFDPMSKKVQNGTSGYTIYHHSTQFHHRVTQVFSGLCNFSTRLQILWVTFETPGYTHTVGGMVCHIWSIYELSDYCLVNRYEFVYRVSSLAFTSTLVTAIVISFITLTIRNIYKIIGQIQKDCRCVSHKIEKKSVV